MFTTGSSTPGGRPRRSIRALGAGGLGLALLLGGCGEVALRPAVEDPEATVAEDRPVPGADPLKGTRPVVPPPPSEGATPPDVPTMTRREPSAVAEDLVQTVHQGLTATTARLEEGGDVATLHDALRRITTETREALTTLRQKSGLTSRDDLQALREAVGPEIQRTLLPAFRPLQKGIDAWARTDPEIAQVLAGWKDVVDGLRR